MAKKGAKFEVSKIKFRTPLVKIYFYTSTIKSILHNSKIWSRSVKMIGNNNKI